MKKTKLLAPLFGLATVAAVAAPMMACGPKNNSSAIQMSWHDASEGVPYAVNGFYSAGFETAMKSYTFKFSITTNEQKVDKFGLYVSTTELVAIVNESWKIKVNGTDDTANWGYNTSTYVLSRTLGGLDNGDNVEITITAATAGKNVMAIAHCQQ